MLRQCARQRRIRLGGDYGGLEEPRQEFTVLVNHGQ